MTTPDRDGITTYGGPWKNLSPVEDPSTDVPDAGFNQMAESVAAMTQMCPRALAVFTGNASIAPSLSSHMSMWGNSPLVAPSLGRAGAGSYTLAWPVTVNDEITSGPGFTSPHTLNFIRSWANATNSIAFFLHPQTEVTAPNVVSILIWSIVGGVPTLTDPPTGAPITVFVI